jgi:predicted TIM-barrel fold metal-dependent hydrolase
LAPDGRFAQVLMGGNGLGKPFGHPVYHPIYKAAAEAGLPIAIHLGGDAVPDTLTHPTAGGLPSTYAEYRVVGAQALMTHVVSLIGQGVFERYPNLRVVMVGGGVTWIPALIWRMDTNFNPFGREAPWLTRKPSEYFREHVLVAAQPLERPRELDRLRRLLASFRGIEKVLCFASAYPERRMETPNAIAEALPEEWQRAVFHDNAAAAYGERVGSPAAAR